MFDMKIDGKDIEVISAFSNNNKNYLIYKVDGEITASSYILTNELVLSSITDEEEWQMVEAKIKELMEN